MLAFIRLFALVCMFLSGAAPAEDLVFEEDLTQGLLVHCASSADTKSVLALQNAGHKMAESLAVVNGGSAGVLCIKEEVQFQISKTVEPAEMSGTAVEITPVRIVARIRVTEQFPDGVLIAATGEVRYTIFRKPSSEHYASLVGQVPISIQEVQVKVGGPTIFSFKEGLLCDSLDLVKQYLSSPLLAVYPVGCGHYDAERSSQGVVPTTAYTVEEYPYKLGTALLLRLIPHDRNLKVFYSYLPGKVEIDAKAGRA